PAGTLAGLGSLFVWWDWAAGSAVVYMTSWPTVKRMDERWTDAGWKYGIRLSPTRVVLNAACLLMIPQLARVAGCRRQRSGWSVSAKKVLAHGPAMFHSAIDM